jgi:hypothetical protein
MSDSASIVGIDEGSVQHEDKQKIINNIKKSLTYHIDQFNIN